MDSEALRIRIFSFENPFRIRSPSCDCNRAFCFNISRTFPVFDWIVTKNRLTNNPEIYQTESKFDSSLNIECHMVTSLDFWPMIGHIVLLEGFHLNEG